MDFDPKDQKDKNRKSFMSSIQKLATVSAVIATLFWAAPVLYLQSEGLVKGLVLDFYGDDWLKWGMWTFRILTFPLCFFAIRATLVTAIVAGAITAALKFV